MTKASTTSTQNSLHAMIADDAHAMSFQSIGQYRAALMQQADNDGKDAVRYRWLRDKGELRICAFYMSVGQAFTGVKFARETVAEATDAARISQIDGNRGEGK